MPPFPTGKYWKQKRSDTFPIWKTLWGEDSYSPPPPPTKKVIKSQKIGLRKYTFDCPMLGVYYHNSSAVFVSL